MTHWYRTLFPIAGFQVAVFSAQVPSIASHRHDVSTWLVIVSAAIDGNYRQVCNCRLGLNEIENHFFVESYRMRSGHKDGILPRSYIIVTLIIVYDCSRQVRQKSGENSYCVRGGWECCLSGLPGESSRLVNSLLPNAIVWRPAICQWRTGKPRQGNIDE